MDTPRYLLAVPLIGQPIRHEWNIDVSRAIRYPLDTEHPRLAQALWKLNEKAAFAILLALAEWVTWRFKNIVDLADALQHLEAGYAALIDPRYAQLPEPADALPFGDPLAQAPLKLMKKLLHDSFKDFRSDNDFDALNGWAFLMALLAYHVVPERAPFEQWLSDTLRKTNAQYPAEGKPLAAQPTVPRAFFEADFVWSEAAARAALSAQLARLDPQTNPYLVSEHSLRQQGFDGTPYVLPATDTP